MNLTTLSTITAQFVNDSNQQRYSGLYTQALNLGQQQFALDAKCLFKDTTIAVVGGTATYSLPTDFMWEKAGCVSYKGLPILPRTIADMLRENPGQDWTTLTGDPNYYIISPEEAKKTIRLSRYPPAGDPGGTLVMTYFCLPTDLANGTDVPFNSYALMTQFHMAVAAWAAWFLLASENSSSEMIQKRRDLLQIYNDTVSQASDTFGTTKSATPQRRGARTY
jgi:hypothetical protein